MLKDTVTVETWAGEGAYGAVYADPVTVRWNYDGKRRLVRNANGEEVISEGTGTAHPDDAPLFAPESRLTIDARASRVLSTSPQTFRGGTVFLQVTCS